MNKIKIFTFCSLFLFILNFGEIFGQDAVITTSDGVKLYASIKGDGIPCLFIHGGPGQGSNYWEELGGEIGENHFQMIYLDQRGCGRSSSPSDSNYSIDRMVMDFEEVRKYLGINEWLIMGHSFGGVLQTYYASKHPETIKGMLMFNCTLNMIESIEKSYIPSVLTFFEIKDKNYFCNPEFSLSERTDSIQKLFTTRQDVWKLSFSSVESAIKFGQTYADFDSWNIDFSKAAFNIDDYKKDYSLMSSEIDIPTLFLYGNKDENVGLYHYKKVKFPKMKLVEVNGGHMEFINNKKDYTDAVDWFCEKYIAN